MTNFNLDDFKSPKEMRFDFKFWIYQTPFNSIAIFNLFVPYVFSKDNHYRIENNNPKYWSQKAIPVWDEYDGNNLNQILTLELNN